MPNGRDRDNVVPFRRPPPPSGGGRGWRPPAWLLEMLTRTMTGWIILLNVAIWLVMVVLAGGHGIADEFPNRVTDRLGAMVPELVPTEPWRLVTATFLHANLLHVGMNMLGLGWAGPRTEAAFGKGRYLLLYLLAGLGGETVSYAWHALVSPNPSVGASGAILGIFGALFALSLKGDGWRSQTTQMWFRISIATIVFGIVASLFGAETLDNAAHAGGFAAGAGIGWLMAGRRPWPVTVDRIAIAGGAAFVGLAFGLAIAVGSGSPSVPPELVAVQQALDAKDWDAADKAIVAAMQRYPDDGSLVAEHGHVLQQLDRKADAAEEYRKALALDPDAESLAKIAIGLDGLGDDVTARKAAYRATQKDPADKRWSDLYDALKKKSGG